MKPMEEIKVLAGVGRRYANVAEARAARVYLDEDKEGPPMGSPPLAKGGKDEEPSSDAPLGKKGAPDSPPEGNPPMASGPQTRGKAASGPSSDAPLAKPGGAASVLTGSRMESRSFIKSSRPMDEASWAAKLGKKAKKDMKKKIAAMPDPDAPDAEKHVKNGKPASADDVRAFRAKSLGKGGKKKR